MIPREFPLAGPHLLNLLNLTPLPSRMSPLHELAVNDDRAQLEKYLDGLRKSGEVEEIDKVDEFGFTPLHLAADRGELYLHCFTLSIPISTLTER